MLSMQFYNDVATIGVVELPIAPAIGFLAHFVTSQPLAEDYDQVSHAVHLWSPAAPPFRTALRRQC